LVGGRESEDRRDGMALDSLPRWLRDFIEYSDELADRDTGRRLRFGVSDNGEGTLSDRGKKKQRRLDELLRLLQNPAYAQLYREATETIQRIDDAAERARSKLARERGVLTERLESLKSRAAELPDGRKIFRSENGRLITEDGADVTAKRDTIKGLSPETATWKEFRDAQTRLAEIQQQQREIDDYMQDVIDPARERLTNPDNPPTMSELREFQQTVEDAMPSALRHEIVDARAEKNTASPLTNTAAAGKYVGPAGLNAPDLSAQFEAASPREPYGSQATKSPATPKT
jgi:hypothetical protein